MGGAGTAGSPGTPRRWSRHLTDCGSHHQVALLILSRSLAAVRSAGSCQAQGTNPDRPVGRPPVLDVIAGARQGKHRRGIAQARDLMHPARITNRSSHWQIGELTSSGHCSAPSSSSLQNPGEWSPGLGSAQPIACDGPEGRPRSGDREPDNRKRGRRPCTPGVCLPNDPSRSVALPGLGRRGRAGRASPEAEPGADAGPAAARSGAA